MAYTYHGTRNLITAPGRSVQTFPSGLVRVERTYLCRRGDEARYRSQLAVGNPLPDDDGAPAIDGLYIFPEPQEQSRDDGFVEFRVTAYGRTNIFLVDNMKRQSILSSVLVLDQRTDAIGIYDYILSFSPGSYNVRSSNEAFTISGVIYSTDSPLSFVEPPAITNPLILLSDGELKGIPLVNGVKEITKIANVRGNISVGYSVDTVISIYLNSLNAVNFGRWTEYTVTWKSEASVNFGPTYSFFNRAN